MKNKSLSRASGKIATISWNRTANLQRQAKDFEGKIESSIASKFRFQTSILEVEDQIASETSLHDKKSNRTFRHNITGAEVNLEYLL